MQKNTLIFFSGLESVGSGKCDENHMFSIDMSTLASGNSITANTPKQIFEYHKEFFSDMVPSLDQMNEFSSAFDYASLLVVRKTRAYYLIHGGCSCYSMNKKRSDVITIDLDSNLNFYYQSGSQNISLS